MTSVLRTNAAFTAHQKPTVGDSKISFVSIDHLGWLRCDGRSLSVADYGILYKVIGTTFGGSGAYFNLPDASGVVPGISSPAYPTGTLVGEYTHTLTIQEMPVHNHDASGVDASGEPINTPSPFGTGNTSYISNHNHGGATSGLIGGNNIVNATEGVTGGGGAIVNAGEGSHDHTISGDGAHLHTIASNGLGEPHNNMQPTLFIGNLFIYCGDPTEGAWPYFQGTNIY